MILAAGASSRFGSPKWRAEVDGERLLDRVVRTAHDAGLLCLVVSGAHELQTDALVVHNPNWETGLSSSLSVGVAAARERGAERVVIVSLDQYLVTADDLRELVDRCDPISAASYAGVLGIPACFAASIFDELQRLTGDRGARTLLRDSDDVHVVEMPHAAFDIDTRDDLP